MSDFNQDKNKGYIRELQSKNTGEKYARMRKMWEMMKEYYLEDSKVEEALCYFFHCGPRTLFNGRTKPFKAGVKFPYLQQDQAWVDTYIKYLRKRNNKGRKQTPTKQGVLSLK